MPQSTLRALREVVAVLSSIGRGCSHSHEHNVRLHSTNFASTMRGHPALIGRHAPFPITHQAAERCLWSPERSILGVAFSKHLVQIYAFNLNEELRQHLEIDAHIGSVNDIAFSYPKKTLSIITCGNDKAIKSTASVAPQLRQPPNGILMTNERSDNNPEEATTCIGLSKNDSYATSVSGGKVSLLNMRTFKVEQKHALVEGLGVLHVLFEDSRIEVKDA
ncbi:hypothetical protein ZIOFF_059133 [Zingiber officinale]|uniref:Uncharacterized protein n=1 Tax=Zingiber officinale TaxID=94328 RepID=A0A8J5F4I5_ZINOF|nr:hypothetical protein ZIOFF_059133 [Zingiber officinale]